MIYNIYDPILHIIQYIHKQILIQGLLISILIIKLEVIAVLGHPGPNHKILPQNNDEFNKTNEL